MAAMGAISQAVGGQAVGGRWGYIVLPMYCAVVNLPNIGTGAEGTALAGGVEASGCKGSRGTTRSPEVFMIK